jgi:hypothetical protein
VALICNHKIFLNIQRAKKRTTKPTKPTIATVEESGLGVPPPDHKAKIGIVALIRLTSKAQAQPRQPGLNWNDDIQVFDHGQN